MTITGCSQRGRRVSLATMEGFSLLTVDEGGRTAAMRIHGNPELARAVFDRVRRELHLSEVLPKTSTNNNTIDA